MAPNVVKKTQYNSASTFGKTTSSPSTAEQANPVHVKQEVHDATDMTSEITTAPASNEAAWDPTPTWGDSAAIVEVKFSSADQGDWAPAEITSPETASADNAVEHEPTPTLRDVAVIEEVQIAHDSKDDWGGIEVTPESAATSVDNVPDLETHSTQGDAAATQEVSSARDNGGDVVLNDQDGNQGLDDDMTQSALVNSYPPTAMSKDDALAQGLEDDTGLQFPLAFYEYEDFVRTHKVDLDQVMLHRRPYPVAVEIRSALEEDGYTFDDMTIRIHVENAMPTFTLVHSSNPNSSSLSKDFRKITIAFGAQLFKVVVLEGGKSFTLTLDDPALIAFSVNPDAPQSIAASPVETHLKASLSSCKIWTITAHSTENDRLTEWGVTYWFGELEKCRLDPVHRARQWATNFMYLLKKEDEDSRNSRSPVEAFATFRCVNAEAVAKNENTPHRLHFSFCRPPASSFPIGSVIAIASSDAPISGRAPYPMMRVRPSDHMKIVNPWLGLVLAIDESTANVTCLLLHCPKEEFPAEALEITIQRFHSSSELSKSLLIRAHAYFKCVGPKIAIHESEGIRRSEHAARRHTISIPPLIFSDLQLPDERNIKTLNFQMGLFPRSKRVLNPAQAEALDHCTRTAGRLVLVNGPPGTGKSLFLSKIIALAMFSNVRILVSTATNAALDVLLRKTLSTYGTEKPPGFSGQPRIIRIVAPSRTQVELLISNTSDSTPAVDDFTQQFDLSYQRVELAKGLNTVDSIAFLKLHETFLNHGFFHDRKDAREYERIANNFDGELVNSATVCFTTTSMATHKAVVGGKFPAAWCITDEAANCRMDQLFNTFLLQPQLDLLLWAGDPVQLPPFVTDRLHNSLGDSLYSALVARGFVGLVQLTEQHRMEENLIKFVNDNFYDGILTTALAVTDGRPQFRKFLAVLAKKPTLPNGTVITSNNMFLDVSNGFGENDAHSSTKNQAEAKCAMQLTCALIAAGLSAKSILIITPYSAQVQLIRHLLAVANISLKDIAVQTIDSTQGDERDVVILSLARAGWDAKVGFLADNSRVVVALTRQKLARYVLGNQHFLEKSREDHGMKKFLVEMVSDNLVQTVIVADVPTAPGRPPRSNYAQPRAPRDRAPRPERVPDRALDPVHVPSVLPQAQIAATKFFTDHDANDY